MYTCQCQLPYSRPTAHRSHSSPFFHLRHPLWRSPKFPFVHVATNFDSVLLAANSKPAVVRNADSRFLRTSHSHPPSRRPCQPHLRQSIDAKRKRASIRPAPTTAFPLPSLNLHVRRPPPAAARTLTLPPPALFPLPGERAHTSASPLPFPSSPEIRCPIASSSATSLNLPAHSRQCQNRDAHPSLIPPPPPP